jgi:predicted metal-dependent enzyme (double-stranded beta helix superfamily)
MTFTSGVHKKPASLKVSKPASTVNLIVHGQGVVVFDASGACSLTFCDASGQAGLKVEFKEGQILSQLEPSGEPLLDPRNAKGIVGQRGAYYWVSVDSQNQRLYAGVGEPRIETAAYVYQFEPAQHSVAKASLESLVSVQSSVSAQITRLIRDPITRKVPMHVKPMKGITMDLLAAGTSMPKGNLSHTMQKLYECIAGAAFKLDGPEFPQFSQAIEHSIRTPGCWCYERLKKKATEFNKDKPDPSETYLRITMGENNGESPGIPYVMEIWPVGHYSPVHNHGGSSAIIRVLHGAVNVSLFPFLSSDPVLPFAKCDFKKGDITWISPGLNQLHQLKNLTGNKDTCITIQCYMYEEDDKQHYDYFDYVDADGGIQQFEPDSDMEFTEFKATMRREWLEQRGCGGFWCT